MGRHERKGNSMIKRKHAVDTLFALLLYGMFTLFSLLLVLIGAQVYKRIVSNTDARSDVRTSLTYVANRIRAESAAGSVRLDKREGLDVLVLTEQEENRSFETLIYFYEGTLRELFQASAQPFSPEAGEELTPLHDFSMEETVPGLLSFTSTGTDGVEHKQYVQIRTAAIQNAPHLQG